MSRKITRIVTEEADVGMTSFWEEAERSFEQTITVTQNGLPTELSMVQAVMQTLIKSALKGSPQSLRQVTELSRLTAEARKREILEEISQWEVIQGRQYQKYKAHRAAHGFDPMDFPHPSDIVLDRKSGVRILLIWKNMKLFKTAYVLLMRVFGRMPWTKNSRRETGHLGHI
jgi:hypothetical protein